MNIRDELRRTFNPAAQVREAKLLLSEREWNRFTAITQKYTKLIAEEKKAFRQEFKTRTEIARQRLIDKAGAKDKAHKPIWSGNDRFDKASILRQARREVHGNHARVIARLEDQHISEREAILDRARKRHDLKAKASHEIKRDFMSATDRRSGLERRQLRRSR